MASTIIGQKIKHLRTSKKWSQAELATMLGVTQQTVANYENGTRNPDPEGYIELARIFDVSLDYLFGRKDELGRMSTDELEFLRESVKEETDLLKIINNSLHGVHVNGVQLTSDDLQLFNDVLASVVKRKLKRDENSN